MLTDRTKKLTVAAMLGSAGLLWVGLNASALAQTAPALNVQPPVQTSPQSVEALLRLGDLYSSETVLEADYTLAYSYYLRASAAGSRSADLRIAEMLAKGQGVKRDTKRSLGILEELAAKGEVQAHLALAELYSRGDALKMSPTNALRHYEAAASLGNASAMVKLGFIYLYGRFGAESPLKAMAYFRQAAELGNAWGQYGLGKILAERMVRKAGSRDDGIALLAKAAEAGIEDAVVAISDSYFHFGKGRKTRAKKALAVLNNAASKGNITAALELVAIYRDGKRDGRLILVARNLATARSQLAHVQDKLSRNDAMFERILLGAVTARFKSFKNLSITFDQLRGSRRQAALREIHRINLPLYVYLAQKELASRGLYSGKITGAANAGTLRALSSYCKRKGTRHFCKDGPLGSGVAELLAASL
jgi:TPR repeat protein